MQQDFRHFLDNQDDFTAKLVDNNTSSKVYLQLEMITREMMTSITNSEWFSVFYPNLSDIVTAENRDEYFSIAGKQHDKG